MRAVFGVMVCCVAAVAVVAGQSAGVAKAHEPIVKVADAYVKAAHAGDAAALKLVVIPEAIADLNGPHGKEIVGVLQGFFSSGRDTVTAVEVKGDTAVVTITTKYGEGSASQTVQMKKVGPDWKVDPKG